MGTRSLTFVHENDGPAIICVYQQYDGYFDGVGESILTFLKGSSIVNGIGSSDGMIFNGAGDLAARLVTHFKGGDSSSAGAVYIEPSTLEDGEVGTEYAYHIYCSVGKEPRLVAKAIYSDFTIDAYVSEFVWPMRDDDGNYIVAPAIDNSGLLRSDQRAALFASFSEVFGDSDDERRYAFTRLVLDHDGPVSWSSKSPYCITAGEASKVLDALDALSV